MTQDKLFYELLERAFYRVSEELSKHNELLARQNMLLQKLVEVNCSESAVKKFEELDDSTFF